MEIFLESLVSPQTRRSYERGIKKFMKFYGKDLKSFLKERDPSKIIERYYARHMKLTLMSYLTSMLLNFLNTAN